MADQPETVFATQDQPITQEAVAVTPEVKAVEDTTTSEPYADLLKGIVRDDGTQKYANVPDVIKAVAASQEHIRTLEAEAATTKAELDKRISAEEVLEQLKANTGTQEVTPSDGLDVSQITELVQGVVDNTLSSADEAKISDSNIQAVISAMTTKFGTKEKAEEHYLRSAEESGLSVDAFNMLSATSPQAVLKLAGVDGQSVATPSMSTGSINTEALQPQVHTPSAKVPQGASAKQMANSWVAAGS